MQVQKEQTVVYSLLLTEDEARLLKGMVQNPLSNTEDPRVTQLRSDIWKGLTNQGVEAI